MPGTSHQLEYELMSNLPFHTKDAAKHIVNNFHFKDISLLLKNGPTEELTELYPKLTSNDWKGISKRVFITRATYFEINQTFNPEHLKFLAHTVLALLDYNAEDIGTAVRELKGNYRYLAMWLESINSTLKVIESAQAKNAV